ncbi:MAG TPA: peptidylprolyl isomerase [Methylibium sp.]|uniref:peptidylprolyl isomerase n=1 Tax=Methylibium sp. TaxID=2067992 RepID=UPI002DB733A7|nr:peptidylprolyl isomerase [Methylibium sp.]HEU4460396.1 peptidylprolyl isomerase [Methylibium sp.]
MPATTFLAACRRALPLLAACVALNAAAQAPSRGAAQSADYIVAVVDRELVTNSEVEQRIAGARREAQQSGQPLPSAGELRRQVIDQLIEERAQLSAARDSGVRVDDPELDRAVANVAQQNRLTLPELRERLARERIDFARFRANLRDQILLERVREREVQNRIKISDADVDALIASRASGMAPPEFNVAQLLFALPESATPEQVEAKRQLAERALARARGGEDFTKLVNELSEGAKEQGGALGLRALDRLPDLFATAVKDLRAGAVVSQLVRSGAGFHVLKVIDRRDGAVMVEQTRARHVLLRPSAQLSAEAAAQRLREYKQQIEAGRATFAQIAREVSEDGSAQQGGDLGWATPGQFVPEFEAVMKTLAPQQISDPVTSRFGVHMIQVTERRQTSVDRKQQREIARNLLREQKFETAYAEWLREVRARAYIEIREPPQ